MMQNDLQGIYSAIKSADNFLHCDPGQQLCNDPK